MTHAAFSPSNVAVITGGASGIGLAAARCFAAMSFRVCIVDIDDESLQKAADALVPIAGGTSSGILPISADVGRLEDVQRVAGSVQRHFGRVDVLMNNAGVQPGSGVFGPAANWDKVMRVNLWGVIHGTQVFAPQMIAQRTPGLIINTGSKQGITTPPGDPAYNVSKAGVKVFTEALQHELRSRSDCLVSAHLLIPGFVFTALTANGRTEKPPGAWTPEQTVSFMLQRLEAGDFYILCPDNEVTRAIDEKRIRWAAEDLIENRPPLSRWHADYADQFKSFLDGF